MGAKRYVNPEAKEAQILRVSHYMVSVVRFGRHHADFFQVAFFAVVMGLCGLIFFYIGVSMGWLYVSPT